MPGTMSARFPPEVTGMRAAAASRKGAHGPPQSSWMR
jgi:hypothetical protein